jgi:hypothetical protein
MRTATPPPTGRSLITFTERHRAVAATLTLLTLVVAGTAVGGLLAELLVRLVDAALATVVGGS